MNRFFVFLLFLLFSLSAALADADIAAVQSALKERGFYYGAIDGQWNDGTSAAVSRFQIRDGQEITGRLTPETLRGLGLPAANYEAAAPRGSWKILREEDAEFLAAAPKAREPVAPPAAERVTRSREEITRERLRDFVAAFVLAGLDPDVNEELAFFADRVRYFDDGLVSRKAIRGDLRRYNAKFPERRFRLAGELEVTRDRGDELQVSFPLRYEVRSEDGWKKGTVRKTLDLRREGRQLTIVGVNEERE